MGVMMTPVGLVVLVLFIIRRRRLKSEFTHEGGKKMSGFFKGWNSEGRWKLRVYVVLPVLLVGELLVMAILEAFIDLPRDMWRMEAICFPLGVIALVWWILDERRDDQRSGGNQR